MVVFYELNLILINFDYFFYFDGGIFGYMIKHLSNSFEYVMPFIFILDVNLFIDKLILFYCAD